MARVPATVIPTNLAAIGLALLLLLRAGAAGAEDWPRWGGPRGNGTWQGPKLPERWPDSGLPVVWKATIGGGYGGIAVAAGRAFVMDRVTDPDETERLLCFDAGSGARLWIHGERVSYGTLDYGNGPRSTPTVQDGAVYTLGATGRACRVDAETGELQWRKDYPRVYAAGTPPPAPAWGLAASPVVWEDLVIFHPGAENGGCIIALDKDSGAEVWRASDDPAGYATPIVITSPSGPLLIAWTPENILGIAPRTGKLIWTVPYKVTYGVSIATPIYEQNTVFVTGYWEGAKAIRLGPQPDDARILWEDNQTLRGLMTQPIYRDGHVYMLDKSLGLTCFELESGRKVWDDRHQATPRGRNPQASLVWLDDRDRALILNELGELILARLNPQGYHEQARTRIIERHERSPIWAHPAYAGTRVYARSDTEMVCIELIPGQKAVP